MIPLYLLFLAKVNPLKISCLLSIQECDFIVKSVKKVLNKSIKQGGSSIIDFEWPIVSRMAKYMARIQSIHKILEPRNNFFDACCHNLIFDVA